MLLLLIRVSGHDKRCFLEDFCISGFIFLFSFVMIFLRLVELETFLLQPAS